tara:strand:- start:24 stop:287 length:264 start_codon:yes stop_codon:yes gene_type:complete
MSSIYIVKRCWNAGTDGKSDVFEEVYAIFSSLHQAEDCALSLDERRDGRRPGQWFEIEFWGSDEKSEFRWRKTIVITEDKVFEKDSY